jgi:hypothetical protein
VEAVKTTPAHVHAKLSEKKKPHLLPIYLFGVSFALAVSFVVQGGHL